MGVVLSELSKKTLLVSDGAWGTMLQTAGLPSGVAPELWNVDEPAKVTAVAKAYFDAGSDMVLTNTFGGSRAKLEKVGLGDQVARLNAAGARNSLAAKDEALVAGSVGPTGEFLEPLGLMTEQQMEAIFAEQIGAMVEAGLRAVCVETMTAPEEAACAVRAAKTIDADVDVISTFTFDPTPHGYKTMMGTSPADAVAMVIEAGADIVGANCGTGMDAMVEIAAALRAATDKPILIHANAGMPELVEGETVFKQGPDEMASHVEALIGAGANIIGGCCGTTPDHIAAIRAKVDAARG